MILRIKKYYRTFLPLLKIEVKLLFNTIKAYFSCSRFRTLYSLLTSHPGPHHRGGGAALCLAGQGDVVVEQHRGVLGGVGPAGGHCGGEEALGGGDKGGGWGGGAAP